LRLAALISDTDRKLPVQSQEAWMSAQEIAVDYLIIGAGATGMAFADVLVNDTNYTVAIVDRNDAPGGHWTVSYPFVRLHGPSSFYGVNSRPMVSDSIGVGNLASRNEILDYYDRVMEEFVGTGRVTYLPRHSVDSVAPGSLTVQAQSLLTGATVEITARKRVVDASYMNITVPAMGRPAYEVENGASLVPINQLVDLDSATERFTVIGAGKTGIDACLWLLNRGVDPDRITWIAPRDAWLLNRELSGGASNDVSALLPLKECQSANEVIGAMEQWGVLMRRDVNVDPAAFRCATVNPDELARLRQIEHVVRMGRVRRITATSVHLDGGTIQSAPGTVHIDCSADGLTQKPLKPVFSRGAITLQTLLPCLLTTSGGIAGRLETLDLDDEARNNLVPPVFNPSTSLDLVSFFAIRADRLVRWHGLTELFDWLASSRFATSLGGFDQVRDPEIQAEVSLLASHLEELAKAGAAPAQ
jgi:hypothetical protein